MEPDGTRTASNASMEKVRFPLERDEYGWPPVCGEVLWSERVGPGLHRLSNTPWFAPGVSHNDIVRTVSTEGGVPVVVGLADRGGHMTVRMLVTEPEGREQFLAEVASVLFQLGVRCDAMQAYGILAIDVPPSADQARVKWLLVEGEAQELWSFEESDVTCDWMAL